MQSFLWATAVPALVAACSTPVAASNSSSSCIVTEYSDLANAVATCTDITLQDLAAPYNTSIDLRELQDGSKVTFAGTTTFEGVTAIKEFYPILFGGKDLYVTGAPGHVIDGNGSAYWDGVGSNGGSDKPNWFLVINQTYDSTFSGLNIKNWPVHGIDIVYSQNITLEYFYMDNSEGDAPNDISKGKAAAHNSDGFGVASSDFITIRDTTVINQDDCWAATSGTNITVSRLACYGGHGLSIGSIGGKSNNTVSGVLIEDSILVNSSNGARIKTNYDTTGEVSDITYRNISISGITDYGLDVQQDYLNGGPTGEPSNGVKISNIKFIDITGTASGEEAYDVYILCGEGSCTDFYFENVNISGGDMGSSCNYPESGCPVAEES